MMNRFEIGFNIAAQYATSDIEGRKSITTLMTHLTSDQRRMLMPGIVDIEGRFNANYLRYIAQTVADQNSYGTHDNYDQVRIITSTDGQVMLYFISQNDNAGEIQVPVLNAVPSPKEYVVDRSSYQQIASFITDVLHAQSVLTDNQRDLLKNHIFGNSQRTRSTRSTDTTTNPIPPQSTRPQPTRPQLTHPQFTQPQPTRSLVPLNYSGTNRLPQRSKYYPIPDNHFPTDNHRNELKKLAALGILFMLGLLGWNIYTDHKTDGIMPTPTPALTTEDLSSNNTSNEPHPPDNTSEPPYNTQIGGENFTGDPNVGGGGGSLDLYPPGQTTIIKIGGVNPQGNQVITRTNTTDGN